MVSQLSRIFEAGIEELRELRSALDRSTTPRLYADILYAYLKSDVKELERISGFLVSASCKCAEREMLHALSTLRLEIRQRAIREETIAKALSWADKAPEWCGEIHFVAGWAFENLGRHEKSKLHYRIAANELGKIGAKRKALKADMNHLAADSCIDPDSKRLIADYLFGYRQARKLKEFGIAGNVLNNVSREYHRIGACSIALKFSNRALALLERDFGTLHYYLAVVHRANVLLDMGRKEEAQLDLDRARASDFLEVKSALAVLEKKEGQPVAEHLTPTWRERRVAKKASPLTETENALIELLAKKPCDKFEIMDALYGETLSVDVRENRLKVSLSRLRTKLPGLIILENGRYRLSEKATVDLPTKKREKRARKGE